MKFNDKVLAFISRWVVSVTTLPGEYRVDYGYESMPQTLRVYKESKTQDKTKAETIFAPSKKAYLDDDILEKEVFDTLNTLKEKVDREHLSKKVARIVNCAKDNLKEAGYDTSVLDIKCDDTTKWVTIRATATDGPRTFTAEKMVTYEQVLQLCDPVSGLVGIMGELIGLAEGSIGDDMEPAEAINIINHMLNFTLLSPWQKEALGVAVKALKEKL